MSDSNLQKNFKGNKHNQASENISFQIENEYAKK